VAKYAPKVQKTRQNTPGSEKMWKKILKAATREEEYALLVENMDKILAGEVEPYEIHIDAFMLVYKLDDPYEIELKGNAEFSKIIYMYPLNHGEFVHRLYFEEYRDNYSKARNLIKKHVFAKEAKIQQEIQERNNTVGGKVMIIFESVIDDMVSYYTRGIHFSKRHPIREKFKPVIDTTSLFFATKRSRTIQELWNNLTTIYLRRLRLSVQIHFQFSNLLRACFDMLSIPSETPLEEIDNFVDSSGPDFSPLFKEWELILSPYFVDKDEEFFDSLRELFG